ncbi:MAG: sortase B protein-sorting domain-containing protein [Clostridia bacterium]|nr:sortase B protein-sorting domain-containing protein [Clostridia bacterium]
MRRIRAFEGRVVVSHDQFETAGGYPPMRSFCMYRPIADDPFCTENVLDPQTGKYVQLDTGYIVKKLRPGAGAMTEPLLSAQSELDTAALYRPLLISPADGGEALYLRSEVTETVSGQSVEYEIHIVDDEDVHNALSGTGTLYLPYPEGMTMDSAAGYEVTIRHLTDEGVEVFSTQDGSITLTPNGFSISVSSLSPFEVSWVAPATASLPLTGDAAPLGWYGALLALSALAIACLRRHRKA